jgi:hypothetical protein
MKQLTASESTIIYSTEPLWGTLFAFLILHENVQSSTFVGAFFIITACLFSSVGLTAITAIPLTLYSTYEAEIDEISSNILTNWSTLIESITDMIQKND